MCPDNEDSNCDQITEIDIESGLVASTLPWDEEQCKLLKYCFEKQDVTEWNRQYSQYLLGKRDVIKLKQQNTVQPTLSTFEMAIVPQSDRRSELVKRLLADMKNSENQNPSILQFSHQELAIICYSCLGDVEIVTDTDFRAAYLSLRRTVNEQIAISRNIVFEEYDKVKTKQRSGAKLQTLQLIGEEDNWGDLKYAILCYAELAGAIIKYTSLHRANLEKVEGLGITLDYVNLCYSILNHTGFVGSTIVNCEFGGAKIINSDFSNSTIKNCKYYNGVISDENGNILNYYGSAILTGTEFLRAKLDTVFFEGADLSKTIFKLAELRGVKLRGASLKSADFTLAYLDPETIMDGDTDLIIDSHTNFTGVGLASIRITPNLRTKLEKNVRKLEWEKWYQQNKIQNSIDDRIIGRDTLPKQETQISITKVIETLFINIPAKCFWWISDYGSSTKRILGSFFLLNIIFTIIYIIIAYVSPLDSILSTGIDPITAFIHTSFAMFSILSSWWTHLSVIGSVLLFIHVFLGYVILAALVTRFAIMFQSLSP